MRATIENNQLFHSEWITNPHIPRATIGLSFSITVISVGLPEVVVQTLIIYIKTFLHSDWLRALQFFFNSKEKS